MLALKTATNTIRPLANATKAPKNARGLIQAVLYGSEKAKEEGEVETLQHSKIVGRGKYIHAFETHRVRPEVVEQYQEAAEKYYTGLASDASLNVKLTGGWETVVGALDTYVHVLEYENYRGYDHSAALIRQSKEHTSNFQALLPFLQNRNLQLCQEFAFWASSPPHQKGGIFELRTYQLQAGTLLEWETAWRKGIEARRKFAAPVGAWFSQVGRLHQVHHMWQFESLESRKALREKAWTVDGWASTVDKTAKLTQDMDSSILKPLPYSPLR
ncbi:hypothetical protein FRB94_010666 [Tulasnella sp. JGI-2019a]|nr:hypothetical protein FRB94_010666 [Tulasnella sp. JGI-2019a]KAG9011311.1 hypothetical protein FRB93_003113 [Tulasnella sp. JGI-2019a]KAG9037404.1 hypothetical protein FRB95_005693 [Tulasnella sp. JGI-2019a]